MSSDLTKQQQALYDLMSATPDTDVNIPTMWRVIEATSDRAPRTRRSVRDMQQGLGPYIARINAKLDGQRIEPGRLKQTYRLTTT